MDAKNCRLKWEPVISSKIMCNNSLMDLFIDELSISLETISEYESSLEESGQYLVPFLTKVQEYFDSKSQKYLIEFNDFSIKDNEMFPVFTFEKTGFNPLTGEILYYMDGEWFDYKNVSDTLNQKFIQETKLVEFIQHECKMVVDKVYNRKKKLDNISSDNIS
jgi:hypothetical protein